MNHDMIRDESHVPGTLPGAPGNYEDEMDDFLRWRASSAAIQLDALEEARVPNSISGTMGRQCITALAAVVNQHLAKWYNGNTARMLKDLRKPRKHSFFGGVKAVSESEWKHILGIQILHAAVGCDILAPDEIGGLWYTRHYLDSVIKMIEEEMAGDSQAEPLRKAQ